MNEIFQAHDKFFKELLSYIEVATDLLKNAVEEKFSKRIVYSTLRLDKTDYRDEYLAALFSDVVYECQFEGDKGITKISILWEHKSTFSPEVKFDLHSYIDKIWRTQVKQKKTRTPVVSIIFSQNPKGWKPDGNEPLFPEAPEQLQRFIPAFDYLLIDLSEYSDTAINEKFNSVYLRIGLLLMKHAKDKGLLPKLWNILEDLDELLSREDGKQVFISMSAYLYTASDENNKAILKTIEQVNQKGGKIAMTAAQQLRQEAVAEKVEHLVLHCHNKKHFSIPEIADVLDVTIQEVKDVLKKYGLA